MSPQARPNRPGRRLRASSCRAPTSTRRSSRSRSPAPTVPGRYDPSYEERGNDYPVGFVRWTEQRNLEAVLDMLRELAARRRAVAIRIGSRSTTPPRRTSSSTAPSRRSASCSTIRRPRRSSWRGRWRCRSSPRRLRPSTGACRRLVHRRRQLCVGRADRGLQRRGRAAASRWRRARVTSAVHAGTKFGFATTTTDTDAVLADSADGGRRHSDSSRLACVAVVRCVARRQARIRREAACPDLPTSWLESRPRTGRPPPTARRRSSWWDSIAAMRSADRTHRGLAAQRRRAEGVRHDGQCRRDSRRPLDAGSLPSAADESSVKPATSSTCCGFSPVRRSRVTARRQCARRPAIP